MSATCTNRLHGGPLRCTREQGHPHGCIYRSDTGSDVDDSHSEGGHG